MGNLKPCIRNSIESCENWQKNFGELLEIRQSFLLPTFFTIRYYNVILKTGS